MNLTPGPTLADASGNRRVRKLEERIRHIDDQIAELTEKREIMQGELGQHRLWC
nr:hypothetical protein [uncultured Methanoregula sp.]